MYKQPELFAISCTDKSVTAMVTVRVFPAEEGEYKSIGWTRPFPV